MQGVPGTPWQPREAAPETEVAESIQTSIIVPAWNEASRIAQTIERLTEYFSAASEDGFEVVVVTDGSTDGTNRVVENLAAKFPQVKHLTYSMRLGKGGAIKQGMLSARGERVAFADADGSAPPEEIARLLALTSGADAVLGSRWLNGSSAASSQPLPRRLASRGFNALVRLLFNLPITDTQCGYKAFRAGCIREVMPMVGVTDYAFDVDLLSKLQMRGFRITEVALKWNHVNGSKVRLSRVVPAMAAALIGIRLANSKAIGRLGRERLQKVYACVRRIG